jgi:ferric-dicitrate binding protein FerR (iron transport regulator)
MMIEEDDMYKKYNGYSAKDLLSDDYFISSMVTPTDESIYFWKEILRRKTICPDDYHLACYLFDSLQVSEETVSAEEVEDIWNNIRRENKSRLAAERKNKVTKRILYWSLSGIASLLLCLFLYRVFRESPAAPVVALSIKDVKAPEMSVTEDIHLVLSEHETMKLEGQDAEIVYDKEGVAVHDKKIKRQNKQASSNEAVTYNQLIVPKGKRSTLIFEDGSKMWVNAGTRVVYPVCFAEKKREVYIEGEAYFEISQDVKRPFVVKAKDFELNVLGTTFNVMAYEKDAVQHVVLVSGKLEIHAQNREETILSPDEMYLSVDGVAQVKKVNVSDFISWTRGMYQYKSDRLDLIMKRLSRYYGVEIVCEPVVAHLKFSGKLDLKDDLNGVLSGISRTSPIDYHWKDSVFIIYEQIKQ